MKDKIKSFEEFEARMKNQSIPAVQYDQVTQQKIMERRKVHKPLYFRASFIAILLSVFVTASIATAVNYSGWKLFNQEGKQIFEINKMSEDEEAFHKGADYTRNRNESVVETIKKAIPEGEFKYFLEVKGYEDVGDTSVLYLMNDQKIGTVTQIPNDVKESFQLKDVLQDKFMFTEGTVSYYPLPRGHEVAEREALTEELYKEAKEKNVPYITKDGTLTSEISSVWLEYENEDKESYQKIIIQIRPSDEGMVTNENIEGYTKEKVDGIDILHSEDDQRVLFIKEENSKKFLVSIKGLVTGFEAEDWENPEEVFESIETVRKEELIAIAKSILK